VVVEPLDLGQADRADVHVLEVRRQVDLHLEAVDAGGTRRVVTFQAAFDRELDLPAKPVASEAAELNGRLLLGLHREVAEHEPSLDLAGDLLGQALVAADALLAPASGRPPTSGTPTSGCARTA